MRRRRAPRLDWAANLLEQRGSLTASELGATYHENLGYHGRDQTCDWCVHNGGQLLARLIAANRASPIDVLAEKRPAGQSAKGGAT